MKVTRQKTLQAALLMSALAASAASAAITTEGIAVDANRVDLQSTDSSSTTARHFYIGYDVSSGGAHSDGKLTIDGGSILTGRHGYLGYYSDTTGEVLVTGAGSAWIGAGTSPLLYVGRLGTGKLTISDGAKVSGFVRLLVSEQAGSHGDIVVTGAGSELSFGGGNINSSIGNNATGTLSILNGGKVVTKTGMTTLNVGYSNASNSKILVDGAGSTMNLGTSTLALASNNSIGVELTVSNGALVYGSSSNIGAGAGSQATATITGQDSIWALTGGLSIGHQGTGTLTVSDGAKVSTGAGITISNYGTGTLNILSGGTVTVGTRLTIGYTGTGTLNLNGGTLNLNGNQITRDASDPIAAPGSGTAIINFTSGSLLNVSAITFGLTQQGGLMNTGTASSAIGQMSIAGDYTLASAGTLVVDTDGTVSDVYSITGNATLAGLLSILPTSNAELEIGDTFQVLTAASIDTTGLSISDGYSYSVLAGETGQILEITVNAVAVPEPTALSAIALGSALLLMPRRKRV